MSLDTYGNLKASVTTWLRRADVSAQVPDFITMAEAQMNRRLRCKSMMARATLTISGQLTPAPADFAAPRSLRLVGVNDNATLSWVSDEQMDGLLDGADYTSGQPVHYTLEGTNFRFSPDPGTTGYTASLSYYARIPALSDSNTTNWLLAAHPDAYLYGAMVQSAPYLKNDDRLQTWAGIFEAILADINASDRGQGGVLAPLPAMIGI